ncbi:hypothetical protein SDC9_120803 [bioreactor metagenome]|uniref:Uncharacterized protein n=1 Tax=bioreactor metagenome TaxID=1076179 RepID=A0A645CA87_9ZZZZ
MDLDGYAIFHMAKELYSGKSHITVSELSDPELINDKLLRLIVNAFLVRRYGINVSKGGDSNGKTRASNLATLESPVPKDLS